MVRVRAIVTIKFQQQQGTRETLEFATSINATTPLHPATELWCRVLVKVTAFRNPGAHGQKNGVTGAQAVAMQSTSQLDVFELTTDRAVAVSPLTLCYALLHCVYASLSHRCPHFS